MFRFFLIPSLDFVAPQFIYVFANGVPEPEMADLFHVFTVVMIIYLYTSIILFQPAPPAGG